MFRKAARGLASLDPPMPFMAWREELQEMAGGLRSANPLATSGQCQSERISDNHYNCLAQDLNAASTMMQNHGRLATLTVAARK